MIITIDGPVASGKSSVARLLAKRCGYHYLSTGIFYRAITYVLITYYHYTYDMLSNPHERDIDAILSGNTLQYSLHNGDQGIISFQGIMLNPFLKSAEMDKNTSILATNTYLRKALINFWRRMVHAYDLVVEGRDTGTVVFPQADVKFFLTADQDVRASRWQRDQEKQHHVFSHYEALSAIKERDERDSKRAISPLTIAADAKVVDNSSLNIEQTVDYMENTIKKIISH